MKNFCYKINGNFSSKGIQYYRYFGIFFLDLFMKKLAFMLQMYFCSSKLNIMINLGIHNIAESVYC